MKEYLFSYGALQKGKVQKKLFGRKLQGREDILKGYKISPIEIMDESFLSKGEEKNQLTAIISKDKNDSIKGTSLVITEEELLAADKYEPANYKRIKVMLESGREAWIYLAVEAT
ncbi:MAG TPA: gamma-glutamylcyclotransferase family protein [Chitinophagaceae bacterium]|nr:gamma-glutamylcyclotransferase family protein [Chitinophagaceae bacterium]